MNRSTPGLPVHHQLLEFTQTHVCRVSDAICRPLLLLPPIPPSIRVFSNESTLRMTNFSSKYLCDGDSGNGSGDKHILELLLLHGVAESDTA